MPPRLLSRRPTLRAVGELLVLRLRLLGVRAGEHPVPVALGEHRRLEVRLAERAGVVHRLCELERALHVFARRLVVTLTAVAARAPREHVQPKLVARQARALGERQGLVEKTDRGRDARKHVPAHPQAVQHLGAVDVGKLLAFDERARVAEQRERALDVARLGAGHRLAVQRAHLQLARARAEHRRQGLRVLADRVAERVLLEQRVGARQDRLGLRPLVGGDAAREEPRVDAQPEGEPVDRLGGRARLAALDLRDVLLREPLARDVRLRQAGGDAQLAQALAEACTRGGARTPACAGPVDAEAVLPRAAREVIGRRSVQDT